MNFELPKQLQDDSFRFVKLKEKIPFEKGWQSKGYKFNDDKIRAWLSLENNIGVIGGYGRLRIQDIDNKELANELKNKFKTFMVRTGSGGAHFYFKSDLNNNFVLKDDLGEFRANNYQVVAPNMKHPNGNFYRVEGDLPIREISEEEFMEIIRPYMRDSSNEVTNTDSKNTRSEREFKEVLRLLRSGKTKKEIFEAMNDFAKWSTAPEQYRELTYNKALDIFDVGKTENKKPYQIFEKEGQAIEFIKRQPLFFDKSQMWWIWNFEESKYELTDKTQILTDLKNTIGVDVIKSKERTEIINALEVVGREHLPQQIPRECIQFKNKIINVKTGEEFESSPKYFATNPIPWALGESEETPTMDKYFLEWVGEKFVDTLYEIIAYSTSSSQFMQRMFALVGGGSNGKGTFIKLLKKFIGKSNCASSELRVLTENYFETSAIYKKLICEMGEVSHDDLKNTNQIKKLAGEDDIRYCFKGKTPFTEESSTTLILNTNSLPVSQDRTKGFYRRWLIIDFPNQFDIKEGLIESIPDIEFENLAKKSISILKKLYQTHKFTNEGDIDERAKKYEERSNPVMRFIEERCEEDYDKFISLKEFAKEVNEYLKSKHLRALNVKEIKKSLIEEGFEVRRTTKFGVTDTYIFSLSIQLIQKIHKNDINFPRNNLIGKKCINGINCIENIEKTLP